MPPGFTHVSPDSSSDSEPEVARAGTGTPQRRRRTDTARGSRSGSTNRNTTSKSQSVWGAQGMPIRESRTPDEVLRTVSERSSDGAWFLRN